EHRRFSVSPLLRLSPTALLRHSLLPRRLLLPSLLPRRLLLPSLLHRRLLFRRRLHLLNALRLDLREARGHRLQFGRAVEFRDDDLGRDLLDEALRALGSLEL